MDVRRRPGERRYSRRAFLTGTAAGAIALTSTYNGLGRSADEDGPQEVVAAGADLKPQDAATAVLDALQRFPLVALAERHLLQEWHDFVSSLLLHPALPSQLTDIVVEFGNALHQDTADRFLLELKPVTQPDLQAIWRFTVGGNILWDAPVYAQFFRTVRTVNMRRPADRRIRVLLGDPPFDHNRVKVAADLAYVRSMERQRDSHYADLVVREVLRKNRGALLVAGTAHLLRGLKSSTDRPNVAGILETQATEQMFVVDPLILPPDPPGDPLTRRILANIGSWSAPSLALLKGTWLGATSESVRPWINSSAHLGTKPEGVRYDAQANAVLYLGTGQRLTASQADPSLYIGGDYAEELRRLSKIASAAGRSIDLAADGLRRARAGPSWFEQWR